MRSRITCSIVAAVFLLALVTQVRTDESPFRLVSQPTRPKLDVPALPASMVGAKIVPHHAHHDLFRLDNGARFFANRETLAKISAAGALTLVRGDILVDVPVGKSVTVATSQNTIVVRGQAAIRTGPKGNDLLVVHGTAETNDIKLKAGEQLFAASTTPQSRGTGDVAWARDLVAAAAAPLVPASVHVGGALVAVDPQGQEAKLILRKQHLDVVIEDGFARTTIDQTFFNQEQTQLEGTFFFPLPADASLSRLAMYVDGKLMEGGIVERNYGRQVYETIRYANRDPALLEWVDGTTFKMRVFPLEPRTEKRILLSYTQKLPGAFGTQHYRFPAGHSLQTLEAWSVDVRVKDAKDMKWSCPSHPLEGRREGNDLVLEGRGKKAKTDRDLVLELTDPSPAARDEDRARFSVSRQDGAEYLMLRYRPKMDAAMREPNPQPAERPAYVCLFESSGDRDPLSARAQIEILRHFLGQADPEDTFVVAAAGTRVTFFDPRPRPINTANIQAAVEFLEKSHLIGALDLGAALDALVPYLGKPSATVVHLGSGIPALGERRHAELAAKLPRTARYVGIGVGRRWNREFMQMAAERTGGLATQINPDEPLAWRAFELTTRLAGPRLLNVKVEAVGGDPKTAPRFLVLNPTVCQGEELCAVAKTLEALPRAVKVTGSLNGKPFSREIDVKFAKAAADYLPRTWAKLEVDRLLAEDSEKHKEAIIALSKAMYVMTPFTSLLVLEHEDLYVQYKVDRGRKDHWAMYAAPQQIAVVYEPLPGQPDPKLAGKKPSAAEVVKSVQVRDATIALRLKKRHNEIRRQIQAESLPSDADPAVAEFDADINYNVDRIGFGGPKGNNPRFGVVLAGMLVPDLNVPIKSSSYDFTQPPMGGFPGQQSLRFGAQYVPTGYGTRLEGFPAGGGELRRMKQPMDIENQLGRLLSGVREDAASHLPVPPDATLPPMNFAVGGRLQDLGKLRIAEANLSRLNIFDVHPELPGIERLMRRESEDQWITSMQWTNAPENLRPIGSEWTRYWQQLQNVKVGRVIIQGAVGGEGDRNVASADDRIFFDLVAYAPGLNTSRADLAAILDAEARPDGVRGGRVEPAARVLIDKARELGWRTLRFDGGLVTFDGAGRYVLERTLPPGIQERVVCDGTKLLHLYPQLALAAERAVTWRHQAELADLVPCWLPSVDMLSRGADIKLAGPRTIAVVPHGRDAKAPWAELRFVFGDDGSVRERQIVLMPKEETLVRWTVTADGDVTMNVGQAFLPASSKRQAGMPAPRPERLGKLESAAASSLAADTKHLLVVPMPYRTAEHVKKTLKIENKSLGELRLAEALPLFMAHIGAGKGDEAKQVFQQCFHNRDQRQLGYYVLLAACGVNLDSQNLDVLAEHQGEPLAQYLALHSSPVLRKHASQWAVGSGSWQPGLQQHLATAHALLQRWQNVRPDADPAKLRPDRVTALAFVKANANGFGWGLLGLLQQSAGKDKTFHTELADAYAGFEKLPGWSFSASYEKARCLWRAGKTAEARTLFERLYREQLNEDRLPQVDPDFRTAMLGGPGERDLWNDLLRASAQRFIEKKQRVAVLALAWQCWQLDDAPLASDLFARAVEGATPAKDAGLLLTGVQYLSETGQIAQADELLRTVLSDATLAKRADLWRLAASFAERRDLPDRRLECLEKALDAEYRRPPEKIALDVVRRDYGQLLEQYQKLADAMVTLKLHPEPAFLAKVVQAADRWRALDRDTTTACTQAAAILRRLGERELAWDYVTTPAGIKPHEAESWQTLAANLGQSGELDLADRAYQAAVQAEPTNPQHLWDRAENLRRAGKTLDAEAALRRIAEGNWQPRFQGVQNQAKARLDR